MSFDYSFEPQNSFLSIVGKGEASIDDRAECVYRALCDASLPEKCHILIDVRLISNEPKPGDVQRMMSLIKSLQFRFNGCIALLTIPTRHVTASSIIALSTDATDNRVIAFTSIESARHWLETSH